MQRLLNDFDTVFDLAYPVGEATLGELVETTVAGLAPPKQDWGSEGERERVVSEGNRFVSFHYRPHLFPGMELRLRLAHELQFRLLPRALPAGVPVSIAAVLESYCHLSGDLFGWRMLRDGKFLLWIVDMAGHGIRAGLASAVLRVLLDHLRDRSHVDHTVTELNHALHECRRPGHDNLFATGFFLAMGADGRAVYASAGHPPMMVRRADGRIEELAALDMPIGLFPDTTYRTEPVRFEPGDTLLMFTDGLLEATGRDGEAFGLERLRAELAPVERDPQQITQTIFDTFSARQDIDRLEDDVTFLAARYER